MTLWLSVGVHLCLSEHLKIKAQNVSKLFNTFLNNTKIPNLFYEKGVVQRYIFLHRIQQLFLRLTLTTLANVISLLALKTNLQLVLAVSLYAPLSLCQLWPHENRKCVFKE